MALHSLFTPLPKNRKFHSGNVCLVRSLVCTKEVWSLLFNKNAKVLQYGTKSYLLSPISLNYTENKKVSHFGKIQYWIQNDSHTHKYVCKHFAHLGILR